MAAETGNANTFGTVTNRPRSKFYRQIRCFDYENLEEPVTRPLGQLPTTGNDITAAKTGNTHIYLGKSDSFEIPTVVLAFSTTASSKKLRRQLMLRSVPEMVMMQPKPEIFLSLELDRKSRFCRWNFDAMSHSSGDTSGFGGRSHIAISGCRSLLQSPAVSFFIFGSVFL